MLVTAKLGANFSRGSALPMIASPFLLTHPNRLTIRELSHTNATRNKGEQGR
jgi:hypothetical protein